MNRLRCLMTLIALTFLPTVAFSETIHAPSEELPALISTALANNPELKSSRARWQMYTDRALQASSLEDPMTPATTCSLWV